MNAEKILKGTIKIAAVCLTAPATLAVASTLYADWGLWRWVTAGAALVLVEGALLLGWQLLDSQGKTATSGQRGLYAALVIVAYVVLWAIALAHNEGLAGIAFRATLGVLIAYSLADAGILAGLRQDSAVLRDFTKDGKVRRHQKRLGIATAIARLDAEHDLERQGLANTVQEQQARLATGHKQAMQAIAKQKEAITEGSTHSYPFPIEQARDKRQGQRLTRKAERLNALQAAIAANPTLNKTQLGELLGVSRQTISNDLADLQGNGNGRQLTFLGDSNGNGSHSPERITQ